MLELMLVSIGNTNVSSQPFVIKGVSHTKSNVTKIGGGAAAGAIIGGIVGGGKGAAVGAGVGAGAGTATAAATGKKPAKLESEAVLTFVSNGPSSGNSTGNFRDNRYSGHDDHAGRGRSHHDDDDDDDDGHERRPRGDGYTFGDRDRVYTGSIHNAATIQSNQDLDRTHARLVRRVEILGPLQSESVDQEIGRC